MVVLISRARGYKTFYMLNSAEHRILNAHKYKTIKKFIFLGSNQPRTLFFLLINVKTPTNVGTLIFISREKFMLCWVEHEKSFITSGPDLSEKERTIISLLSPKCHSLKSGPEIIKLFSCSTPTEYLSCSLMLKSQQL